MAIDLKRLSKTQLEELAKRVQSRTHELHSEQLDKARAKVTAYAKAEGYSIEELFGGRGRKKQRRKAAPKFRNPANRSETWSGRGKRPRWFNAALAAGKKQKDLLI